jgi:hypothetical protein
MFAPSSRPGEAGIKRPSIISSPARDVSSDEVSDEI